MCACVCMCHTQMHSLCVCILQIFTSSEQNLMILLKPISNTNSNVVSVERNTIVHVHCTKEMYRKRRLLLYLHGNQFAHLEWQSPILIGQKVSIYFVDFLLSYFRCDKLGYYLSPNISMFAQMAVIQFSKAKRHNPMNENKKNASTSNWRKTYAPHAPEK